MCHASSLMCSWANSGECVCATPWGQIMPPGRLEKTCFAMWSWVTLEELTVIGFSYLSCEKMTRHDYITALVANGEAEQTQESVCVVLCVSGMPPGFGFVCQVILLKKLDYSAYEGIMHLNFPIVCMHVLENVHDFCGTIVFLVTFNCNIFVFYNVFCLFILIVLYFLFFFIYLNCSIHLCFVLFV